MNEISELTAEEREVWDGYSPLDVVLYHTAGRGREERRGGGERRGRGEEGEGRGRGGERRGRGGEGEGRGGGEERRGRGEERRGCWARCERVFKL